ncbi:MAG TPA: hypothetical protein VH370_00915 [Humisphaera sp.]|jgi:hypothetical protein|nr:hypothetical protein [Humisphaera sp.]
MNQESLLTKQQSTANVFSFKFTFEILEQRKGPKMAKENQFGGKIPESPLLANLITAGAANAVSFRGYVGPSSSEEYVTLFPNLDDLSERIVIARTDVLNFAEFSEDGQPSGGVIVWVKRDAIVSRHRVETIGSESELAPVAPAQVNRGRLIIQLARKLVQEADNCYSNCSEGNCHSNCR